MAARRLIGYAALVCVMASPLSAQTTRVETIEAEQKEKARHLGTEGPSDAELIIRRVLLSPLLSGGEGVYPWFGSVFGGSGAGFGVGYLNRFQRASFVNVLSAVSVNGSRVARGTYAAPSLWRNRMQLDASAQWLGVNDVSFFGPGQHSDRHARQFYSFSPASAGANVTIKPANHVVLGGNYTVLQFATDTDSPRFTEANAPGFDRTLHYSVTRASVMYDWRPSPAYSTRGGFYRARFDHYHETGGQPYSFRQQEYEVAQMVPLVREQFVLAVRGLVTLTSTGDGEAVPVVLAPYLGSGSTLRGFAHRRFTDRNRALLTGEYRWRPSRYMDMALFVDAGQVSPRHQFEMSDFDVAWGVGARVHGPTFTALRIEVARSREGVRLVFSGSQPF